MKERSWLASVSQMDSTVAVMLVTAARPAARRGGLHRSNGGGNNAVFRHAARNPITDEFPACILRTNENFLKTRLPQHGFDFVNAGSTRDTTAERGEIAGNLGGKIGSTDDVRNGEAPTGFENTECLAEHLRFVG